MSETCRVSFQNKFEKSVHLVGFSMGICDDAWSHERKEKFIKCLNLLFCSCNNHQVPELHA